jgi:hypothetical protein
LSKAQRGIAKFAKIDCKGVHYKPLRGIAPQTRTELLGNVRDKEMSFKELERECRYIKRMKEVRDAFMSYLNIETWVEAV